MINLDLGHTLLANAAIILYVVGHVQGYKKCMKDATGTINKWKNLACFLSKQLHVRNGLDKNNSGDVPGSTKGAANNGNSVLHPRGDGSV